jgi:hypothetical protein
MSGHSVYTLLHTVPKLDGQNYHDWKFAMSMVLRRAGCWEVVSTKTEESKKDEAWTKAAEEALSYIGLTVMPNQYSHIRTATNGAEAWKALADVYEKNSRATRISLKRQFYGFRHDTSASIQEYISGITTLAARIEAIGITLTPNDITDVLIFNLDESYSSIAASLTAAKGELTVADVTSAIIDEEGRRSGSSDRVKDSESNSKEENVAYYAHSQKSIKCFNCGKMGHMARNCRAPKKDEANAAFTAMDDENDDDEDGVW